jgi:hypothetical protein
VAKIAVSASHCAKYPIVIDRAEIGGAGGTSEIPAWFAFDTSLAQVRALIFSVPADGRPNVRFRPITVISRMSDYDPKLAFNYSIDQRPT